MGEPKKKSRRRSRSNGEEEKKQKKSKQVLSREEKRKRRKRQVLFERIAVAVVLAAILIGTVICLKFFLIPETVAFTEYRGMTAEPNIDVQLLSINEYSRPGIETDTIRGVVIHYTANLGSTAQQNRDYFENLKDTHLTKASSNFIVGLEGEIIQCVPESEIAYASNSRNSDTISIECCHPDEDGKFTEETYRSAVELTAFLCSKFSLTEKEVIRHYDVTGKDCPRYFVAHEAEWEKFKSDVGELLKKVL